MMMACTVDRQCRTHRNPPNHLQFELDLDAKGFLCYGKDSSKKSGFVRIVTFPSPSQGIPKNTQTLLLCRLFTIVK